MKRSVSGFSLFDVMVALVLLSLGISAVVQVFLASTTAVGVGRRWTAMAVAANRELGRLERNYRASAPGCLVPAPGTTLGLDGVTVSWTAVGDSVGATVTLEARAASARRSLVDTVVAGLLCR